MPFFNHSMAQSMRKQSSIMNNESLKMQNKLQQSDNNVSNKKKIQIRSMPYNNDTIANVTATGTTGTTTNKIARSADPLISLKYTQKISQRKLLFTRSLLRSQIEQLQSQECALLIKNSTKLFNTYQIDTNNRLSFDNDNESDDDSKKSKDDIQMYPAKNIQMPEYIMMATILLIKNFDIKNSLYLKILRHLGRKHPYIINTWEIFYDEQNIFIFQEFITHGNILTYLNDDNNNTQSSIVNEKQLCFWSKQLYRALDFLGDNGIAHRNIKPNHLLLKPMGNELCIKLTGFKQSIIYWNIDENDINFCQCFNINNRKEDGANFQAPEVYGNPNEYFDPIIADIWSFGANLFFILTKYYPYNIDYPHNNLDEELLYNISKITNISQECQNFLFSLMRSNANDRIPFDFIDKDEWFKKFY